MTHRTRLSVEVTPEALALADEIAAVTPRGTDPDLHGRGVSRASVLREALAIGLRELADEHLEPR